MKVKNKEVNIFNMALLDILCGALGAFCFMMLVLFQYWKPEGADTKKAKVDTGQLEEKIQKMMDQMKNMSNLPPDVAQRLQQMEKEFQGLREQVGKLKNMLQNAQAQTEAFRRKAEQAQQQAAAANKDAEKMKNRNPMTLVMTTYTANHDVDLYVKDDRMEEPSASKVQGVKWTGDVFFNSVRGPASDVWMMRDVPAGQYKVYYKFLDKGGNTSPAVVDGYFMQHSGYAYLPRVTINNDKENVFAGTIFVDRDYKSRFVPAPPLEAGYKQLLEQRRPQAPAGQKK